MATSETVLDTLELLLGSGLEYTPTNTKPLALAWVEIFNDVPDDLLKQAARDYLKLETVWPAPAKLRQLAEKVKAHNGNTVAGDPFFARANLSHLPPMPPEIQAEESRLWKSIGRLTGKRRAEWTPADIALYTETMGFAPDSPEDYAYWEKFFSYLTVR